MIPACTICQSSGPQKLPTPFPVRRPPAHASATTVVSTPACCSLSFHAIVYHSAQLCCNCRLFVLQAGPAAQESKEIDPCSQAAQARCHSPSGVGISQLHPLKPRSLCSPNLTSDNPIMVSCYAIPALAGSFDPIFVDRLRVWVETLVPKIMPATDIQPVLVAIVSSLMKLLPVIYG